MAPPQTPATGANGLLPVSVLQKNTPTPAPRLKNPQPRTKLIVRRLPPGLTKAEFEATIGEEWKFGAGKVDWFSYRRGKVSKQLGKPSVPSRAYLHVITPDDVTLLGDHVRQLTFHDAAKTFQDSSLIGPPVVEFAPFHKIPGGRRRNDARQGLIDQEPEFQAFLESLTNPDAKPLPTDVNAEGTKEDKKVTTTPLIEALREKKANKDKPQNKVALKHGRGESQEGANKENKQILAKGGKEAAGPLQEKGKKLTKAEKAAKEAVKVLNKETAQSKDGVSPSSAEKATASAATPSAERKRERGNANIAKSMLQRDLGIGPGGSRRRGKRETTPTAQDATAKPEEAAAGKEKAKETPASPAPTDKGPKPPTSPKKESTRPTRAERRAFKAAQADKTSKSSPEDPKQPPPKAPAAPPQILKKPQAAAQNPPQSPQAPKALAAAKVPPTEPAAARSPSTTVPPTATATQAQSTAQQPTTASQPTPAPTGPSRQAFLKHANASQGITEPLIEAALSVFGAIGKAEIDKRKGFAYVDFADPEGLQKAIAASPVKVAQGAVQVLERKEKVIRNRLPHAPAAHHHPVPPTGPARGRGGFSGRGRGRGGARGGAVAGAASVQPAAAPVDTATTNASSANPPAPTPAPAPAVNAPAPPPAPAPAPVAPAAETAT